MTNIEKEKLYGFLTAIRPAERDKFQKAAWLCRCKCGTEKVVDIYALNAGTVRSCGQSDCRKGFFSRANLTGKRFGKLVVIKLDHEQDKRIFWRCRCDCGNECVIRSDQFNRGRSSCDVGDCWRTFKHGHASNGRPTSTYKSWRSMMQRCYLETSDSYPWYGERGITVCKRWHKFENFLADMGERPANKTLDRKNNNKGYSKANCRWATDLEQARNKRRAA